MSVTGSLTGSFDGSAHPMDSLSDTGGLPRKSMTLKDYYFASSTTDAKQINYQHGLSNFSNVILGDDRVSFSKSMMQCLHSSDTKLEFCPPDSRLRNEYKSESHRRKDYADVTSACGGPAGVLEIENSIKQKLDQRSKQGPLQLRKNFRYYDKSSSGYCNPFELSRALELMGFSFSEIQIMALFARYDPSYTGTILYTDFLQNLLLHNTKVTVSAYNSADFDDTEADSKDVDDDEIRAMQLAEIKKVFRVIDKSQMGSIAVSDLQLLLISLGMDVEDRDLDYIADSIGRSANNSRIEFEAFVNWWVSGRDGSKK